MSKETKVLVRLLSRALRSKGGWVYKLFLIIISVLLVYQILFPTLFTFPTATNTSNPNSEMNTEEAILLYKVTNVIDGDTLEVQSNGIEQKIRLIGVDTPETVDPRQPVQCFGQQAADKSRSMLLGQEVRLEEDISQGDKDRYGRLLRYVFLKDGTNFNKLMISEGYGFEYTYDEPYKYQKDFKEAQRVAELTKQGLWADNTCSGKK